MTDEKRLKYKRCLDKMANDEPSEIEKEVITPYANKEMKILTLRDVSHSYFPFSIDELYVRRPTKNKIYIAFMHVIDTEERWRLFDCSFRKNTKEYEYFNKLLEEANL